MKIFIYVVVNIVKIVSVNASINYVTNRAHFLKVVYVISIQRQHNYYKCMVLPCIITMFCVSRAGDADRNG